ncbi:MAG: PQQ-like beta-propeller repeat protein [Acidimicrobiales bacterium]|nr:PQQ-like beta-propeller repeat protein [Acidimicrobiales bacterium]
MDLPSVDDGDSVAIASASPAPGCRHRLAFEERRPGGHVSDRAAAILERDGWLLDRHEDAHWTGWVDQEDQRYRVTITEPDDPGGTASADIVTAGQAAPPSIELSLGSSYPTDQARIAGDHVVVPTDGGLRAFTVESGEPRWSVDDCIFPGWLAPVPGPDGSPLVLNCGGEITAVDADGGEVLWRRPVPAGTERVRQSRTMLVLQSTQAVRVLDLEDGEQRWARRGLGDAAIAVDDDQVYVGNDDKLRALDGDYGMGIWQMQANIGALFATDDAVFVRTAATYPAGPESARLERLDPSTGERRWNVEYEEGLEASPIVGASQQVVVLTTDDHVVVYDATTGEERWFETTPGAFSVTVGAEHVILTDSADGRTIAYDSVAHRQERLLGPSCGLAVAAGATFATQVSCADPARPTIQVFDLRDRA